MKKNQIAQQYLQKNRGLLKCPICQDEFIEVADCTLTCVNGHSFDIAKKGSVFFLNTPVKTEYDRDMLVERQQIIASGLFDPVLEKIATRLQGSYIIDAGCGEGSQIKKIAQRHEGHYFGFDISKPAIDLAISGDQTNEDLAFFVADLAHMPFADHRFSDVINILSPANYQEFKRVLRPDGQIVKVMPNAHYLQELRQLVYPEGPHKNYDPKPVQTHFLQQFPNAVLEQVDYTFKLTPRLAQALFTMTPLTWTASSKRAVDLTDLTQITVDLTVACTKI